MRCSGGGDKREQSRGQQNKKKQIAQQKRIDTHFFRLRVRFILCVVVDGYFLGDTSGCERIAYV